MSQADLSFFFPTLSFGWPGREPLAATSCKVNSLSQGACARPSKERIMSHQSEQGAGSSASRWIPCPCHLASSCTGGWTDVLLQGPGVTVRISSGGARLNELCLFLPRLHKAETACTKISVERLSRSLHGTSRQSLQVRSSTPGLSSLSKDAPSSTALLSLSKSTSDSISSLRSWSLKPNGGAQNLLLPLSEHRSHSSQIFHNLRVQSIIMLLKAKHGVSVEDTVKWQMSGRVLRTARMSLIYWGSDPCTNITSQATFGRFRSTDCHLSASVSQTRSRLFLRMEHTCLACRISLPRTLMARSWKLTILAAGAVGYAEMSR